MKQIVAIAVLAAASSLAAAETSGFYLGAKFGQGSYDISKNDLDESMFFAFEDNGFDVISASSSLDDKGTGFSVYGGYQVNPFIAVEVGYADLGKAKYRASGLVDPPGVITSAQARAGLTPSAKGPTVALVGTCPVAERFSLTGRAGTIFATTKIDADINVGGISDSESESASTHDFLFGVGALYNVSDKFGFTLDYTRYLKVGDEDTTGEGDVNQFNLGFRIAL